MVEWTLVGRDAELERARSLLREPDRQRAGILLSGSAGVGKSRLAEEIATLAANLGFHVERTAGSLAMRSVPFGPFAHLVPDSNVENRLQLLQLTRLQMRRRAGGRPLAVLVDDGHRLEDGSLALLELLATNRDAFLILTMRTTDPTPEAWRSLTSDSRFEPMALQGLDDDSIQMILEEALGVASDETKAAILRLAGGSPLLLKGLLFHGKQSGALRQRDGAWVVTGDFGAVPGLIDLTEARIGSLREDALQLFRELAVGSPLPREVLGFLDTKECLAELRRAELVVTQGESVTLAHPLYGEVMRSNMGSKRIGRVKERLADAFLASPARSAATELQAATLRLEAGNCPVNLAILGATHALAAFDGTLAERFAEVASEQDDSWVPMALRGRAYFVQQRPGDAEAAFARTEVPPDQPDAAAQLAWARAMNLAFGLGDVPRAKDVLATTAKALPEPYATALQADHALINALLGDFDSVLSVGEPLLSKEDVPPPVRLKVLISFTLAQGLRGRLDRFDERIGEALRLAETYRAELPMAPAQIGLNHVFGLAALGRIDEALAAVEAGHARALREGGLVSLWGGQHGAVLLQAGALSDATDVLKENRRDMGEFDPFRTDPMFLAVEAATRAILSDAREAERLLARAQRETMLPEPRYEVHVGRARGWIAFHEGREEAAIELLTTTGDMSIAATHVLWGCEVLHDVVRLGFPGSVAERLRAAVGQTDRAHYLDTMASHAEALHAGDAAAVERAGEQFRRSGAILLAAEAMAQAAAIFHLRGREAASHRAAVRSKIWQESCGNPTTPALQSRPSSLSDREYEVASLVAARGLTSPQVAGKLFLSTRTVDNHLRSIYRKLEVRGRDELAELWPTDSLPARPA